MREMKNYFKRYIAIFLVATMLFCSLVSCKKANSYTVTVAPCEHGEVVADKTTVEEGDSVTFKITPEENYVLKTLEVNGKTGNVPEGGSYTLCDVRENITVRAEFAKTSVTVNFDTDGKGQIAPITVLYGGKFGALPVPSSDLPFKGWYVSKDENAEKVVSTTRVDVLGERVVFKANVVDRAQLQLVADGNDAVNVLLAPVVRDLVFAAQALHERFGQLVRLIGDDLELDRLAAARSGEEGMVPEMPGHLRAGVLARAEGQHVADLHVVIGPVVLQHGVDQSLRLPHAVGQDHSVPGMDVLDRLLGGDEPCHDDTPSCGPPSCGGLSSGAV